MGNQRIIVTGAAGFIGANFLKHIAAQEKNIDFLVLDALTYAGHYPTIEKEIESNDNLQFVKVDIRDRDSIDAIFEKESPDGIIHFAAESHVDNSIKNPNVFVETNVLGTLNLLNSAKKYCSKDVRFLHVSTDEVYGQLGENDPAFTEEHNILPNSPYSASKASSDMLVRSYNETFGMDTIITRCSNNYGPYQYPEKLIPLMIFNARKGVPLPVYGDGQNIRDWIHVRDHSEGIWEAYKKGKAGSIYNLGGDAEKRNLDVVKGILSLMGKDESLISFVEDRKGHDWRYAIDFSKANKELGWSPRISFDEGLMETINWYEQNSDWVDSVITKINKA